MIVFCLATIRLRTAPRTKNFVSRNTLLGLVFQLALTAEKSWRKVRGVKQLPEVIKGNKFQDGIAIITETDMGTERLQQRESSLIFSWGTQTTKFDSSFETAPYEH